MKGLLCLVFAIMLLGGLAAQPETCIAGACDDTARSHYSHAAHRRLFSMAKAFSLKKKLAGMTDRERFAPTVDLVQAGA